MFSHMMRLVSIHLKLLDMVGQAKSELKRSAVADNMSGKSKLSEVRTSSGMFIPKAKVSFIYPSLFAGSLFEILRLMLMMMCHYMHGIRFQLYDLWRIEGEERKK